MSSNSETDKIDTINLSDFKFDEENEKIEQNKKNYIKIKDKKGEELEKVFGQKKTIIELNYDLGKYFELGNFPEIIYDIKEEENKYICIVYNEKKFNSIRFEIQGRILYVEKLDNKDLILLISNHNEDNNESDGKDNESKKDYYWILVYKFIPEQNIYSLN